jgi:hypothetical protein
VSVARLRYSEAVPAAGTGAAYARTNLIGMIDRQRARLSTERLGRRIRDLAQRLGEAPLT